MLDHEKIIILDFGGQYAHLIASRIRRVNVLAEIYNPDEISLEILQDPKVKGIILSGGPQSVFDDGSPKCDDVIFELEKPVLGICYGHQYLNHSLGGEVKQGEVHEFGMAELGFDLGCPLFLGIEERRRKREESDFKSHSPMTVWMSHGDEVVKLAKGFESCGSTSDCANAAVWNKDRNLYGIQFHPEVTHSEYGAQILGNFVNICEVQADWTMEAFLEEEKDILKEKIGDKNVLLFVSGGVDSTVAFTLLSEVLGTGRVRGLFIDTGLLREGEVEFVEKSIKDIGAHLTILNESERFLKNLEGVYEPEKKREIIGNSFIDVQRDYFSTHDLHDEWILGQGTIYPDTIETGGTKNSATIKTHHNRVPEIQKMIDEGKVVEPLAQLYKDEVRQLGELLGLPEHLVWRHPFPGPGLGVRILCSSVEMYCNASQIEQEKHVILPIRSVGVQGDYRTYRHPAIIDFNVLGNQSGFDIAKWEYEATDLINRNSEVNRALVLLGSNLNNNVGSQNFLFSSVSVQKCYITSERIRRLQVVDHIVTKTLEEMNLYESVWQFPVVLVPILFNDQGRESIILRPIDSVDAMSARVGELPFLFFEKVVTEILKDEEVSAVFLDVTSKPPGTIEWE